MSKVIAAEGIPAGFVTVPQTRPSIVYFNEVGVQMTPHVCHFVRSVFA